MTYGYEVHQRKDRMLDIAKSLQKFKRENIFPDKMLVNYIPLRMKSRRFRHFIDLLRTLQCATFPNGCRG